MFDLFFLVYFVTFSVGVRLSLHLELTSKSGDQKLPKDQGLPVGFLFLRYSVLFTVESLSLLHLLVIY